MQRANAVETNGARKLYRAQGMVAGVCAGVAAFFGVNVTFVRVAFILTAFGMQGLSVFAYLGIWALVPSLPEREGPDTQAVPMPAPSRRKSFFAYVGAAFTILASLVGFAENVETVAGYFQRWLPNSDSPNTANASVFGGSGAESALRDFLSLAERAEADAKSRLDVSQLNRYYAGEMLEQLSQTVLALREQGEYELVRLDSQDIHAVRITGGTAEIDMLEVWTSAVHLIGSNRCVRMRVAQRTPQTVGFAKYPDGWRMTRAVFGVVPLNPEIPCSSGPAL